jgi:hypothetical protein
MFQANCGSWTISSDGALRNDAVTDLVSTLDALFAVHPTPFCGTSY